MSNVPPKWIIRFLEWVCPEHLLDEIEGDLYEHYADVAERKSVSKAKRKAFGFVLLSTPRLLLNRKYHQSTATDMLKNYVIIAFRNIKRQLGYSLVNIFGLAVGLACCILIGLYVKHELSFDRFHTEVENVYRVDLTFRSAQGEKKTFMTPTALLPTLKREFDEVKHGVRVFDVGGFSPVILQHGNVKYQEPEFFFVDSAFFDVFSFKLLAGNPSKCLTEPRSVVLTEYSANKYFGDNDPMNQVIKVDGNDYTVTGVVENTPDNSHFQFDFLASFSSLRAAKQEIWSSANYATYIRLSSNKNVNSIKQTLNDKVKEALGEGQSMSLIFGFMPITDIHLRSDISDEMQPQNSITYIYIISVIGVLILLIACINYMNLATARSVERAREVGMRKVLGAVRKQVFVQFLGESAIVTALSIIVALIFVNIAMPAFNSLTGKVIVTEDLLNTSVLTGLLITFLFVSFVAGAYPALSLSSFSPGSMLKGNFTRSKTGNWMRQILVVFQFSISIFLIIGTLVVWKQLDYVKNKKLGYDKENVIILPTDGNVNKNFETIVTELTKRPDVAGVSIASESPVNIGGGYTLSVPGIIENPISVNAVAVDKRFVENMGIALLQGRHFNDADLKLVSKENREEREYAFIVNEEVLATLLIDEREKILGQKVNLNGRQGEIVGVIENFHSTSFHRKINPLVLMIEPSQYNMLFVRLDTDNLQKTLLAVEDEWKRIVPDRPFVFEFMDEEYDAMYRSEERLSNVFTVFAVLAIVIACLGLFGLVAFAVEKRNKEIGVRKVLGASVPSLFFLISKDFSKLVVIAFVISAPIAYWLMQEWLADFEYKTTVGVWPVAISIVCTLFIALLTISYQSIKAALLNPAETLRAE
ncbi:MAG: ABC transporter permease [Fulvivirga sp.]